MIRAVRDVKETKRRRNRMRSKRGGRKGWGGRRSDRVNGDRKMHDGTPSLLLPFLNSE